MYYTGYCAGLKLYDILKEHMKGHIEYFSTGYKTTI